MRKLGLILTIVIIVAGLIFGSCAAPKGEKATSKAVKKQKITVTDSDGRTVTIEKPVRKIILINSKAGETLRALGIGLGEKAVGVTDYVHNYPKYLPELQDKPGFDFNELNYEKIAELNPDILITYEGGSKYTNFNKLKKIGVSTLCLECCGGDKYYETIETLGRIFDREEEAKEYSQWLKRKEDQIAGRAANLKVENKPRVLWLFSPSYYYPKFKVITANDVETQAWLAAAGGTNIATASAFQSDYAEVSGEWIAEKNPDVIIAKTSRSIATRLGGGLNKEAAIKGMKEMRNKLMNDDALSLKKAVKNGKVFMIQGEVFDAGRRPAGFAYLGKILHPKLFEDIDPNSLLKEYYKEWQGMPQYKWAVIYPPLTK